MGERGREGEEKSETKVGNKGRIRRKERLGIKSGEERARRETNTVEANKM